MITNLIILTLSTFMGVLSFMLPSWALPDYIINSVTTITNSIYFLNEFLPLNALLRGGLIIFSFEIILISVRLISSLLSLVRGGGELKI